MFGFFRRKKPAPPAPEPAAAPEAAPQTPDVSNTAELADAAAVAPQPAGASAALDDLPPAAAPVAVKPPAAAEAPAQRASVTMPPAPALVPAPALAPAPVAAPPVMREAVRPKAPDHTAAGKAAAATAAPAAAAATVEEAATAAADGAVPARQGWLAKLRGGLTKTRTNLSTIFVGVKVDEALYEELETALLSSDAGYATTEWLISQLRERARRNRIGDGAVLKAALRELLAELLAPLEQPIDVDRATPLVMMIAGVNGAGKTTSIGKLARHLRAIDKSVLLAAGDTFRAAAREQLVRWGERNQVQVVGNDGGDPAAVAFDAVKAGIARRTGVVMIDTAGRLPTQQHLMDELRKIRRVLGKAMEGAPQEVLLVLDGNTGQNMLAQVKAFDDAVQLTGLIVTKLDGTAKGGAIAALAFTRRDRPIPVYFIGVGEGAEDLEAFSAKEFASALLD